MADKPTMQRPFGSARCACLACMPLTPHHCLSPRLDFLVHNSKTAGQHAHCVVTQAAELFEVENSTSEANKCRLKIAQYSAELERFPVAIEIYENIAKSQVDNNLLKYSAKGNLLNAGLCRLNGDQPLMSTCMFHGAVYLACECMA